MLILPKRVLLCNIMFTALAFGSIFVVGGEERGLISRTAAGNRAYLAVTVPCIFFLEIVERVSRMKTAGDLLVKSSRLSLQPWLSHAPAVL